MAGGAEYQIAIKIAGNLDKTFHSAISGAQKGLSALGMLGKVGGESMKIAAGALSAVGAGIAAAGTASVNTGREFEAAMSSAAATAGATEEEYAKLEAAAMEMGRSTSKTATESANALEYMSLAGWDVDTAVSALPSVLKASEATGMELAHCSDMITDSMSAAGVAVDDLTGYLDICTRAQNKSNQTAEHLMEAFIGVGGTMKGLNIPIEDTATALGVLANRGLKGSEAGSALNAIMANLTTGTGQAGTMMKKLGISAFDAEGKFIGLEQTLQLVNNATAGLTEEERNAALAAIGGKQHIDALNDLMAGLNTTNAEGVTEWQALNAELYNANGALEEMRAVKLDNFNGDLATFQSALEDTGIRIYKNLQEPLRGAVQFGTAEIYKLSDALTDGGFEGMASAVGDVLADCLTAAANAAPRFIQVATTMAQGMIRGLVSNAPALTSAIADMISQGVTSFMTFYADFWNTGALLFGQLLEGISTRMPEMLQAGAKSIQSVAQGITAQAPTIFRAAAQIAIQLGQGVINALPEIAQAAASLMKNFGQYLQSNLPSILRTGLEMVVQLTASIRESAGMLADGAVSLAVSLAKGLADSIPTIVQNVPAIISNIAGIINDNAPKLLAAGITIVVELGKGLLQAIPVIIANIPQILKAIYDAFTAFNWVNLGRQVITLIGNGIRSMITNLPNIFSSFTETAGSVIKNFGWASLGRGIVEAITLGLTSLIQAVPAALKGIGELAVQWFSSIDWLSLGKAIIDGLISGVVSFGGAAIDTVKSIGSSIWNGVKGVFGDGGKDAADAAADGLESGISAIASATENMASTMTTAAQTATAAATQGFQFDSGLLAQYGVEANTSLANGILSGFGTVTEAAGTAGSSAILEMQNSLAASLPGLSADASAAGLTLTAGMTAGIDSGLSGMSTTAASASLETINAMADGISAGADTITGTISELSAAVTEAMEQCWSGVSETANTAWTDVGTGIQAAMTEIQSGTTEAVSAFFGAVAEAMTAAQEPVATFTVSMTEMTAAAASGALEIQTSLETSLDAVLTTTTSTFENIRLSVENEMNLAAAAVQTAVETMKSAMNFEWQLPHLKVPQVSISGSFSIDPPKAPEFSVSWHREGGILTGAQIFGRQGNTLLGGGEAGKEAVLPLSLLWSNMQTVMGNTLNKYTSAVSQNQSEASQVTMNFPAAVFSTAAAVSQETVNTSAEALNQYTNAVSQDQSTASQVTMNFPTEALQTAAAASQEVNSGADSVAGTAAGGLSYLSEQLNAADIGAESLSVSDLLSHLNESESDAAGNTGSSPPVVIYYQPHNHFEGGAPSREDMTEASKISQEDFERWFDKKMRDFARTNLRG